MRAFEEEPDYLVRTQLRVDPFSFSEVVKEAFLLEHQCTRGQDIARVLGVHSSRVSQIFRNPGSLKPETIQHLLSALKSQDQRRRIVRAWTHLCFGTDIERTDEARLTGRRITEKTLRRVKRQVRESRLTTALKIAREGVERATETLLREQFLDAAYFLHLRLDEPGQAMQIVRLIIEGAKERGEVLREALGHHSRGRILLGMGDAKPEELDLIFVKIKGLLGTGPAQPKPRPPYGLFDPADFEYTRMVASLALMRQGRIPLDEDFLRASLSKMLSDGEKKPMYQLEFRFQLLLAGIYLLLGDTFQAQEHLDKAFQSGTVRNLNAYETCALVKGWILKTTESPEVASAHLQELIGNCRHSQDFYHKRLAEWELARLESDRCTSWKTQNPDQKAGQP